VSRLDRGTRSLVLGYHAVSEAWPAPLSVTPAALRRQLELLLSRGWTATTFTEAVLHPPAARTFAVTFDDGFDSVRRHAAPLLAELAIPGTLFVPTDWPGRSLRWPGVEHWAATPFADELEAMTWDDVRALAADGWEIGAHTCSHPHLSQLDDDAIGRELTESRAVCERELGRACRSIAYPFGDADERVRAAAPAAGYEAGAGLGAAVPVPSRYEWPRVGIWHGESHSRFRLKVSPVTSQLGVWRRLRAIEAAARPTRARHRG